MITRLTSAQRCLLEQRHAEWLAVGLSTAPADRPRAEAAITAMYEIIGQPPPRFVWADSPASAILALGSLHSAEAGIDASPRPSLWSSLWASLWSSLSDSLSDSLSNSLSASLWSSLWASLWSSLSDSLSNSLSASLRDSLRDSLWSSLSASLRASLGASLGASLWSSLWVSLWSSLSDSLSNSLSASLRDSLRDSLWSSLSASLRASLGASLGASLWASLSGAFWGQHEAYWLAYYRYCEEIGVRYDAEASRRLRLWADIAESCGWWWPYTGLVIVSERPAVVRVERRPNAHDRVRLHCDDGPALAYHDGWSVYAVHGVRVPEQVIMQPETLTATQIRDERNAEVRRVMLERFGQERYIREIGAEAVHRDDWGTLWRAELPGDEPLVCVQVVNSTPEPDGSYRDYWLRVPPTMSRAREAVAWTFGLRERDYLPIAQA